MNPTHLVQYVIEPVLAHLGGNYDRTAAIPLLLGTAMVESDLQFLQQHGRGPAVGLYQMEPFTHQDIYDNWLRFRLEDRRRVDALRGQALSPVDEMRGNLNYATAMARVHYFRVPQRLPEPTDAAGLAAYHKDHYNTHLGKTDIRKSLPLFQRAIDIIRSTL